MDDFLLTDHVGVTSEAFSGVATISVTTNGIVTHAF